jgi:hypothetical protein
MDDIGSIKISINKPGAVVMNIESTIDEVQSHIDRGNYHAGINIAISGMNEGRRNNDQACVDRFLGVIQGITQKMAEEFGSEEYLDRK